MIQNKDQPTLAELLLVDQFNFLNALTSFEDYAHASRRIGGAAQTREIKTAQQIREDILLTRMRKKLQDQADKLKQYEQTPRLMSDPICKFVIDLLKDKWERLSVFINPSWCDMFTTETMGTQFRIYSCEKDENLPNKLINGAVTACFVAEELCVRKKLENYIQATHVTVNKGSCYKKGRVLAVFEPHPQDFSRLKNITDLAIEMLNNNLLAGKSAYSDIEKEFSALDLVPSAFKPRWLGFGF